MILEGMRWRVTATRNERIGKRVARRAIGVGLGWSSIFLRLDPSWLFLLACSVALIDLDNAMIDHLAAP